MAMAAIRRRWTSAQVRALIEQSERHWPRYELLDGELLVTPAPGGIHQLAVSAIGFLLQKYMEQERIGIVLTSPADLQLQPESIVQPDVFVVPRHEGVDREDKFTWAEITALLLVVEVISPSSIRTDRIDKRDYYMTSPVDEYWVVDVDAQLIERWRRGRETPDAGRSGFEWAPAGARTPLRVDARALFDQIWSDYRAIRAR
jgi:Uma2 family endonuclease